jgi:hypothetical protein
MMASGKDINAFETHRGPLLSRVIGKVQLCVYLITHPSHCCNVLAITYHILLHTPLYTGHCGLTRANPLKLLLEGANVQLSASDSVADCGVGSDRKRFILQATLGIKKLPEKHVHTTAVQGRRWERLTRRRTDTDTSNGEVVSYWCPSTDTTEQGKPGDFPPWESERNDDSTLYHVGDRVRCSFGSRKKKFLPAKITKAHTTKEDDPIYDIIWLDRDDPGKPEEEVRSDRIKCEPGEWAPSVASVDSVLDPYIA